MVPILCDSPAIMLSHQRHAHFAQHVPHDSATSLMRLDAGMLPSPLTHKAASVELITCASGHLACLAGNAPPHGTHVTPMIISPDDHHMQGAKSTSPKDGCDEEEEFVLYSAPLSSPSADSESAFDELSPVAASPDSPCDRSILPNSAPGFVLSPSPFPQLPSSVLYSSSIGRTACGLSDDAPDSAQHAASLDDCAAVLGDCEVGQEDAVAAEVDDVDALNSLLK